MAEDPDRSKKLLSKDAVPEVAVPDSAPIVAPTFRLPAAIGTPPRASAPDGVEDASGKGARRRRPSTGRFRDRTLNWFKTGDEIDPEAVPSGEYAPAPAGRPPWVVPAIAAGVVVLVVIVLLAVS